MIPELTLKDSLWLTYSIWDRLPTTFEAKREIAKYVLKTFIAGRKDFLYEEEDAFQYSCPVCEYTFQQYADSFIKDQGMLSHQCEHCPLETLWTHNMDPKFLIAAPCEGNTLSPYRKWIDVFADDDGIISDVRSIASEYDAQFFALLIAEEALTEYNKLGENNELSQSAHE